MSEPAREQLGTRMLFPRKVDGSQILHLCVAEVDDTGIVERAICPAGSLIHRPLLPVDESEVFVWCPSCRAYADAVGISLPRSR